MRRAHHIWGRFMIRLAKGLALAGFLAPAALALASSRPMPPSGIHAIVPVPNHPSPAPAVALMPDTAVYNHLVSRQTNSSDQQLTGAVVEGEQVRGPGILPAADARSSGLTLFASPGACLTFDDESRWNGHVWYAAYGNWGTFSVNDGGLYKAENVRFDMERNVGPGDRSGSGFSFKIAGDQPYAAGLISPVIQAPPGSAVSVRAKYLMYNQDGLRIGGQVVNDWISLGLKADAHGDEALYVNGYTRGRWGEITNSITTGESGEILILLQAESPAALNSNIYFDDIEIAIDGMPLTSCE